MKLTFSARPRAIDARKQRKPSGVRRRVIAEQDLPPAIHRPVPAYQRFVKPAIDRILGVALLLACTPIFLLVALTVLASLGRPVLIRQDRVGLHGRSFPMYKFRTMHHDRRCSQEPFDGPDRRRRHKSDNDPRHTRIGRFLRRWSLDEIPQLWNLVAGHMSLVGPRPEMKQIVDRYEPWQHRRHLVKPGITGLWQVTERGNGTLMHERVEVDIEYLKRVSLATDAKILLKTVPAVFGMQRGT